MKISSLDSQAPPSRRRATAPARSRLFSCFAAIALSACPAQQADVSTAGGQQTKQDTGAEPDPTSVMHDVVILQGRVMDPETNRDEVTNVGVKDGKIVTISSATLSGAKIIDAQGLVVAPGFIDTHWHGVDPFAVKLALRGGVTTAMDMELGSTSIKDWYEKKAEDGWQVNYGTTVSLNLTRLLVHDPEVEVSEPIDFSNAPAYLNESAKDGVQGWSVSKSSKDQMNTILQLLDEGLREGAIGVGVGAAYMARGMTSYELFKAQEIGARYGRPASVHTRYHLSANTPMEAPIGFDEVFTNAMLLGAPLLMAHDNDYGWWEIEEKLALARERGLNMWSEYYPYDAGSTTVSADFLRPEIWKDQYGYTYEETLYDPQTDSFLTDATYSELVANDPGHVVVVFMRYRTPWMKYWLTIPHMTVASDAMSGVDENGQLLPWDADYTQLAAHPRVAGTTGKVLRMAREQGVPLMFTLSQLSYWSAKHLGDMGLEAMNERGRLQVGKVADIVIFDPENVTDNASYKAATNGLPTTGIPHVLVSGQLVVENAKVLPVRPGQPIRYPVESESRFEPIDLNKWLEGHTLNIVDVPLDDTGARRALE
jgi:N-acyl-D-amino-acid deacylase